MATFPPIYSFSEALKQAKEDNKNKLCNKSIRLLLGNGFSQAYYGNFSYTTLFDAIRQEKENKKIKKLFEYFGTSNFETVLRFLKDAQFLSTIYKFNANEIKKDYERVQNALASAIVKVHPEKTSKIPDKNKSACYQFLKDFDDVYTVNYDLLLYWVLVQDPELVFGDYFYREEETPSEYCEYVQDGSKSSKHVFFLHGALHLFLKEGITTKKVWGNTIPLIKQIKSEMENGYYPLVVAEGDHESKERQIKENPYLNHAFSTFKQRKGQLFTFGFSFSEQDTHIRKAIIYNKGLKFLWIGIRGDFSNKNNQELLDLSINFQKERKKRVKKDTPSSGKLTVRFFDAGNMDIWKNKK